MVVVCVELLCFCAFAFCGLRRRGELLVVYEGFWFGNGVKKLPRRGRYVESCTGRQNFNVLSEVAGSVRRRDSEEPKE